MEEVQVIDCPPTPEILLASSTPPPTSTNSLLLDMLDSSSSAEELDNCSVTGGGGGGAGDDATESGRSSPPPKCAICLGKCRQKCYTDSCRHQFCYRCLLEWSKIKAECPLCKQVFRSIIYNQKTFDRYQEHIISIVPPASPPNGGLGSGAGAAGAGAGGGGGGAGVRIGGPQVLHRLDFNLSHQPPRFTYSATLRVQPSQSERLQQLFLHQSGDIQRFSREYPDDSIPSRQNGSEWRRYIYHRRLHARPLADLTGRMRECSAEFYRENPAQMHRLMPWINRELTALCRGNPSQVTLIMEDFPNLLMTHDITSPAFRERINYWGRARTSHFIHELLNFARSPYDMIGYDRSVQYDPYYNNSVVVLSSSSSSSSGSGLSGSEAEDDVVRIIEPAAGTSGVGSMEPSLGGPSGSRRGRTQFTIETRSSDQTVIMTGSFGGAGVSGIVSVSTSGSQANNGGGGATAGSSGSASYPDVSRLHPLTSLAPQIVNRLQHGDNISLSSSDSDDCRIVGALKPPHLRTPEMVSLESESDSDVVFVNDDERENLAADSNAVLDQLFPDNLLNAEAMAKLEEHASASEYNNGASTSSGGGGCMKKYYARPKLNRYSEGIGFKSIYEANESEKSKEPSVDSDSDSSSHDEVKFNIRNQPINLNVRKRKATKRRQAATQEPSGSSENSDSDESSTSDSEASPSSSSSSSYSTSSSSSSDSDSDSDFRADETPIKVSLKKRSRKSKVRPTRKSSKRRRKEPKTRSKGKKRKSSSSSKRATRPKRPKLAVPKASKSSSESGKGTSVSCASIQSTEAPIPGGSNTSLPKSSPNSSSTSSSKKRKMRSVIVKPNAASSSSKTSKKRRKAPICSELITTTDFSSEEDGNPEVQVEQPAIVQNQEPPTHLLWSAGDSSDSSEERCTIASLIRAAQRSEEAQVEVEQNTSIGSHTSTTSSNNSKSNRPSTATSCSNSSHSEVSSPAGGAALQRIEATGEGGPVPEVEVSVSQAITVGAEVEL